MNPHHIILTPAPGAVFLRTAAGMIEMTPGEALRMSEEIRSCVQVALSVQDGQAVRRMIGVRTA
jgi:hypothetical protein